MRFTKYEVSQKDRNRIVKMFWGNVFRNENQGSYFVNITDGQSKTIKKAGIKLTQVEPIN